MKRKSFRGIPVERLAGYKSPRHADELMAEFGAMRYLKALHEYAMWRGNKSRMS